MGVSGKTSKVSSVVAALCIVVYIAAIAFGAVRIFLNIGERKDLAEREFYDLADRATSSSVFLGFMSEAYKATIRDFLGASQTLLGIIISGPNDEYSFEKEPGSGITWAGDSPRFKKGAWLPNEPLFLPLGIDGQRNVTIKANYFLIDHGLFQRVLRETLFLVLCGLLISFFTLLVEFNLRKNRAFYKFDSQVQDPMPIDRKDLKPAAQAPVNVPGLSLYKPQHKTNQKHSPKEDNPLGLYMPRGNIGWESYIDDRLSSELHRCASFEQDLVLLVMELNHTQKTSDEEYSFFTEEAVNFFTMRDLIFGKGENGIAVIMPNADLDQGITKSEKFRNRIITKMPEVLAGQPKAVDLCIGLSSRSGRLIDVKRLMFEACRALEKAMEDPVSRIVAFKSDPEKYREFIKDNNQS